MTAIRQINKRPTGSRMQYIGAVLLLKGSNTPIDRFG